MKRVRVTLVTLITFVFVLFISMHVLAFGAEEHDDYLEQVLFGDSSYKDSKSQEIKDKVKMLEAASYLCIDQDRGEGTEELLFLKKKKVRGLPKLDDFDLTGIFYGNHRNYTHRGWDYVYIVEKGKKHDKANWPVRKKILCSTVNKVFDFGLKNEFLGNVSVQCDSFSALVYYVHILGDHIEKDSYSTSDLTIPLARNNVGDDNTDVFYELKKHSEILFDSQKTSSTYSSYIQELDGVADRTRRIAGSKGGVNETNFMSYHKCAEDLMDILITYMPLLLENEDFFRNAFY